ncbi:hypothetical protein BH09MYX1_BH09MYX1_51040 [soil metagenome]
MAEATPVHYELGPDAVLRRAMAGAIAETVSATAPPLFVLFVLARLDVAPMKYLAIGAALLLVLAFARTVTTRQRLIKHLTRFTIDVGGSDVLITTTRGEHKVPRSAVEKVREIPGVLGGLRIELAAGWDGKDDSAEIVDVPRGGKTFAELRNAIEDIRPLEPSRRAQGVQRIGLVVFVVLAVFFVPFLLDLLGSQSRLVALGVVLGVWVALRIVLRPR